MVQLIVIVVAVFIGIYLLSRWLDRGQPSPDDNAVVSDGADYNSICSRYSSICAYIASFWCQFWGPFSNLAEFPIICKNASTDLTERS